MNTAQKVMKVTVGLWELAKQLGNVSQACTVMGYSRESVYRFKALYDEGGAAAVPELSRPQPHCKNRAAPEGEDAVVASALEQPAWGQLRAASALAQGGRPLSAAGVRCVGERNGLENLHTRLRALAAKGARERHSLTEAQLAALETAKVENEAHGEFESECAGSCGAQDTC